MDGRFSSKFVINGYHLTEADTETPLEHLVLNSIGTSAGADKSQGQIIEMTVTFKTTSETPWKACQELCSYGDSKCGHLDPPGRKCTKQHYHKPAWTDTADGDKVCTTCVQLGLTPSYKYEEGEGGYNHRNTA